MQAACRVYAGRRRRQWHAVIRWNRPHLRMHAYDDNMQLSYRRIQAAVLLIQNQHRSYEVVYDGFTLTCACTVVRWQWDLVCDKNYLVEMSQSVFNFGVMVGAIIFTSMADRLGRKPIHLTCQYSMFAVGLVIFFSPNYVTFVVLRFIQGAVREVTFNLTVNVNAVFNNNIDNNMLNSRQIAISSRLRWSLLALPTSQLFTSSRCLERK